MSGKGIVYTARGESLNLDMLIEQAKRPIGLKEAASEITKREVPKRTPINVRAFAPKAGDAKVPEVPKEIQDELAKAKQQSAKPMKSAYRRADGGAAQSVADLTGVRISEPKHVKPVQDGEEGVDPKTYAEQVALGQILNELEVSNPNAKKAADVQERQKSVKKASKSKPSKDDDLSDLED